jgi:hypothetical protein
VKEGDYKSIRILIPQGKLKEFIESHGLYRAFNSKYGHIVVIRPTKLVRATTLMAFSGGARLESRPENRLS